MSLSKEALMETGLPFWGDRCIRILAGGKKDEKGQVLLSYIFPVYSTAGLLLILFALIFQESFWGYSSPTILYLVLLALVPQLIGHTTSTGP